MIRACFRYDDTRWFARVVSWWTSHDSAHVELAWSWDGAVHQTVSSSWVDHGVRGTEIEMPPEKWRIYEIDSTAPQAVTDWLATHEGKMYDYFGLLGFVIRPVKGWLDAWFCSEVCADIIGLPEPWRFEVGLFESVCVKLGNRVQ